MWCSSSNACGVADWSFSSSATRPRQKSEEMTSVGRKCAAANVDLPEPQTPISTTRLSSGIRARAHRSNTASWRRPARRRPGGRPRADRQVPDVVAVGPRGRSGPGAELRAGPLEPVVAVPGRARGQSLEQRVVLDVGGGDDDRARRGVPEHRALKRAEAAGVDVLDDLHQDGGVQILQPVVGVGQRGLEQRQPGLLPLGEPVEPEPARGVLQRSGRHVGRGDVLDGGVGEQVSGQRALAAAEVGDPARASRPDDGEHRFPALFVPAGPTSGRLPGRQSGRPRPRSRCRDPPRSRHRPRPAGRARTGSAPGGAPGSGG